MPFVPVLFILLFPTILFLFPLFNPLNAELNPIRHLLALVGARHIVHVSRIRVNVFVYLLFLCAGFITGTCSFNPAR